MLLQTKLFNECMALKAFDSSMNNLHNGVRMAGFDTTQVSEEDMAKFCATGIKQKAKTWLVLFDAGSPEYKTYEIKEAATFLRAIVKEMTDSVKNHDIYLLSSNAPMLMSSDFEDLCYRLGWDKPWQSAAFVKSEEYRNGPLMYLSRARLTKDKGLSLSYSEHPCGAVGGYGEFEYKLFGSALRKSNIPVLDVSYRHIGCTPTECYIDDVVCTEELGNTHIAVWAGVCKRAHRDLYMHEAAEAEKKEDKK